MCVCVSVCVCTRAYLFMTKRENLCLLVRKRELSCFYFVRTWCTCTHAQQCMHRNAPTNLRTHTQKHKQTHSHPLHTHYLAFFRALSLSRALPLPSLLPFSFSFSLSSSLSLSHTQTATHAYSLVVSHVDARTHIHKYSRAQTHTLVFSQFFSLFSCVLFLTHPHT